MLRQRIRPLKLLRLGFESVLRRPIETARETGNLGTGSDTKINLGGYGVYRDLRRGWGDSRRSCCRPRIIESGSVFSALGFTRQVELNGQAIDFSILSDRRRQFEWFTLPVSRITEQQA